MVMLVNDEVLGTFAQYAQRRVEEAVDTYISKLSDKDHATLEVHYGSSLDPGSHSFIRGKPKYEDPTGSGVEDKLPAMRDDHHLGLDVQPNYDYSEDE